MQPYFRGVVLNSAAVSKWKVIVGFAALAGTPCVSLSSECKNNAEDGHRVALPSFNRVVLLEETATTSANASIGDLNGDGNLDIVLIKGRHWPAANRILFGDGYGNFTNASDLGDVADRSYTGALADLDIDGDLDIVVSNDSPDPKYVYLNDGSGHFSMSSTFGEADWNTRNISLVDANDDRLPDIVVANRGPLDGPSPNYICLNLGEGKFENRCRRLSDESATTITPADVNGDSLHDFVVPSRDGGQSHVYLSKSSTGIDLEPIAFGPPDAAIRATEVADFDCDGIMDIVAIHTRNAEGGDGNVERRQISRGTAIYYGLADGGYSEAVTIIQSPEMPYALAVEDLNQDGAMDIIVGHVEASTSILINTAKDKKFLTIQLGDIDGATYGFDTADLDEDGHIDIVVAKSGALNRIFFGYGAFKK